MFKLLARTPNQRLRAFGRQGAFPRQLMGRITEVSLFLMVLFATQTLFAANLPAQPNQQPNIVLIMTDDQGYGDFGFTGNQLIKTPYLDALAAESVWFDRFYVSPVCSPTRACLLTGRYNYRTRVVDTYAGRSMMDTDEVTIAELLGQAGYRTGIFGKWHLGDCAPMRAQDQGFQESLVHRGGGIGQNSDPLGAESKYTDPVLTLNGIEQPFKGFCTDIYYNHAMSFITDSVRQQQPFFVYIPDNCPHSPFGDVPPKWLKHYQEQRAEISGGAGEEQRSDAEDRVFAMISNIDENIGRLLNLLDNLHVSDNTIVIFLTDNGPNGARYNAGLRGQKTSVYEGGIRTPLLFRWPAGMNNPGKSNGVHAHIDLLPTILDACGINIPTNLDGRSFLAAVNDPEVEFPDRTLFIQTHRGNVPQRYHHFAARDNRWKLVHASGFGVQEFSGQPVFELYDLNSDPLETTDVADSNPEIVNDFKSRYDRWFDDVCSERADGFAPPPIWIGGDNQAAVILTRQDLSAPDNARAFDASSSWWLTAERISRQDITMYFHGKILANEAKLQVGNRTIVAPFDNKTNTAVFDSVTIKSGPLKLRGFIEKPDGNRELVYQVRLQQND